MSEETTAPAAAKDTSLSWMPMYVDDLLALSATLTPAQLGGLMRLRAYAWRQSPPATLPDSDARLATIAGLNASWDGDGLAIREHLRPIETAEGRRLVDPWLADVYLKQLAKYVSASTRGGKGGRPPKAGGKAELSVEGGHRKQDKKLSLSPALSELSVSLSSVLSTSLNQNTEESKAGEKLSFSGDELPERPVSAELKRREDEWLAAHPGERLPGNFHLLEHRPRPTATPAVDPYAAADASVNSETATRGAEARALSEQYDVELEAEVERFREAQPKDYEDHRILALQASGWFGRELTAEQQASISRATAERVRKANGWPSRAAFLANHGKPAPTVAQVSRERVRVSA
jgi:hypothetical protein